MGALQSWLASFLLTMLGPFVSKHGLGRVMVEVLFQLDATKNIQRRPDLAFVAFTRWPKTQRVPDVPAWTVVPNLAVEVISSSNTADEVLEKIRDYFRAGVERVWVIYPSVQQVHVYEAPAAVRVLTTADTLDDGELFPGFSLSVKSLFEPDDEEADQPQDGGAAQA